LCWTLNCLSPLKRGFSAITIAAVLITSPLHAEQTESVSNHYPQLEEYLRIAAEENPELRALWHRYRADLEVIPQVGTLPDPEINIGYTLNPMMSESVLGQFSASVMQMFPWFGTLQARRDMQRASVESGYERLNSRQLALFRNIQTTWFDLAELNQKIAIAQETIKLVRDLEALVEVRYETARAGQTDLLRIQMEEQRLHTLIENLQDKVNPIRTRFNAYLNRDPESGVETSGQIEQRDFYIDEEHLWAKIREQNPEFSELDAREQMLNEQQDLARLNGRPSFGLGIEVMGRNFGPMSMFPDSKEMFAAMATIRVPLWRSRYSAQHRQASEQLRSVDYSRIQTGNRLNTELEQALEQYRESERNIALLTEELLPRAEQAFSILSEEYAAGNTRFDEVLQVQRQLLDLELEQIEAIVKQYKAIINIETLVGDVAAYQGGDE
jgi:outer membrane protein TolC